MVEQSVTRRLTAILVADLVGYSRLMEADEVGTIAQLKTHRKELIDPSIARHRGRGIPRTVIGTAGPGPKPDIDVTRAACMR